MPAANDAAISSSVHKAKYNHKRSRNASPRRNDSFRVGEYGVCVCRWVCGWHRRRPRERIKPPCLWSVILGDHGALSLPALSYQQA